MPIATASDTTTIPFLDETQPSSTDEERKSFSFLAEGNPNDHDTAITVIEEKTFLFFYFQFILKLYQAKSHITGASVTEVLPSLEPDGTSLRTKSESYYNMSHETYIYSFKST